MRTRIGLLLAVAVLLAGSVLAQAPAGQVDVLYLKNGSIVRGQVLELNPAGDVRIRTADGNVFSYPMSDVERVAKEDAPATVLPPPPAPQQQDTTAAHGLRRGFSLNGGVSLPVGGFGETSGDDAGLAKTGFTIGLEQVNPIFPAVGTMTSLIYSYNGVDAGAVVVPPQVKLEVGAWHTGWGLLGVAAGGALDADWQIMGFGQAGVLFGLSPEITASAGGVTATQESALGIAFAYSFGAMVRYGHVALTGRYLSGGEPEYESTLTSPAGDRMMKIKQPTSIVTITLGLVF